MKQDKDTKIGEGDKDSSNPPPKQPDVTIEKRDRNYLKGKFSKAETPSEQDFADLIESCVNFNDFNSLELTEGVGDHQKIENCINFIKKLLEVLNKTKKVERKNDEI